MRTGEGQINKPSAGPTWRRLNKPVFALQFVTLSLMIAPLVTVVTVDSPVPRLARLSASCLWILALAPAWIYVRTPRTSRRPIPFLPVIGILFGLYYALPAVLGAYSIHWRISIDPEHDYNRPAFVAFV